MTDPRVAYPQIVSLLKKTSPTSSRGIINFLCPVPEHQDTTPSAICWVHTDNRLNFKCYAGCSHRAIMDSLGLKEADRCPGSHRDLSIRWVFGEAFAYHDANGQFLARKAKFLGYVGNIRTHKTFRWQRRKVQTWVNCEVGDLDLPLYGIQRVLERKWKEKIYLTEGEACAEAINALGLIGTTLAHVGRRSLSKRNQEELGGVDLVIIPDSNTAGASYLEGIVSSILFGRPSPRSIAVLDLGEPRTMDVRNWVDSRLKILGQSVEETRKEFLNLPLVGKLAKIDS